MIKFDIFPGATHHILTMSYDDGRISDRKLVELFDRYKIKATFHLNSLRLDTEGFISSKEVRELYKNHEISCHTLTHPRLTDLPNHEIIKEIIEDRHNLEKLCGYPVRGMSLPGGDRNENVDSIIKACGMSYCRTSDFTMTYKFPESFIRWNPGCHHDQANDMLKFFLDSQKNNNRAQIFYVMGHSYEFDQNNDWHKIEEFCKNASFLEETWYATNIEIYDYYMAQRSLQFTVDKKIVHNPTSIDVWITADNEPVMIKAGQTVSVTVDIRTSFFTSSFRLKPKSAILKTP